MTDWTVRGRGEHQQRVLELLSDGKPRTCRQIARELGDRTTGRVGQTIQSLYARGGPARLVAVSCRADLEPSRARRYVLTRRGRAAIREPRNSGRD